MKDKKIQKKILIFLDDIREKHGSNTTSDWQGIAEYLSIGDDSLVRKNLRNLDNDEFIETDTQCYENKITKKGRAVLKKKKWIKIIEILILSPFVVEIIKTILKKIYPQAFF